MSENSKFSIKNVIRNQDDEIVGFTAWENGNKYNFTRSQFDPDSGPNYVSVVVKYMDGTKSSGKINIGSYDRLSDFIQFGPAWIPFCGTIVNGNSETFKLINKAGLLDIIPAPEPAAKKDADVDKVVGVIKWKNVK